MPEQNRKVVLITGASSGIGKACATHLHEQDYRVYGASRRLRSHVGEAGLTHQNFEWIQMDVDQDTSVSRGIEKILELENRIDIVVNSAGFGIAGAVEDTSLDEAKAQFETNFFGALRVCRVVTPVMRRQRSGLIVNISSIAGSIPIPFQAIYSASKSALAGLSEALRLELRPYGVHVVVFELGDFNTSFTDNRQKALESGENPAYVTNFERALAVMENDERHGPSPDKIAFLLERIIQTPTPRPRYSVGPLFERIAYKLKGFLPARLFEWGVMKYYNISS